MRKRSARKWLHFILDLLPVIFIPVFMVYSHRHTIDSYVAEQDEVTVVDFNQNIKNGNFKNNNDWQVYNATLVVGNDTGTITIVPETSAGVIYQDLSITANHTYLYKFNFVDKSANNVECNINFGSFNKTYSSLGSFTDTFLLSVVGRFHIYSYHGDSTISYVQLFDLTQMFGSGNEPTIEQFNTWYTDDYYDFTSGRKEALYTGNTITYDETDILSQLMYSMYNATDNYFNFNKLFNMQSIYDWVQVNFFNGTAPLVIPIVWNVIVYELFMDILFLIYAVFMFIVDFATNMVDSFLSKSSKGGY